MGKVTFETVECGGCRTCEIACSYHHKQLFSPSQSSIEITDRPEKLGFAVSFYPSDEDSHPACDRCVGEEEPFCLKYCSTLMHDELKNIFEVQLPRMLSKEVKNGK